MNKEKALKNQGLEFREDIYLTGGHKLSGNSQLHIKKSLKTEDFSNIQGSVTKSVTVTFLF